MSKEKFFELARFVTPILVTIGLFIAAGVRADLDKLQASIFELAQRISAVEGTLRK